MSDRTFVQAMWTTGLRTWDEGYALDWVLTSVDLFSRGVITEGSHIKMCREVREAQRRFEQLRLDGVTPTAALEIMFKNDTQASAGLDSPPKGSGTPASGRNTP